MHWRQFWVTLNKRVTSANVCEGGARVSYDRCYRGGYGIIQWTSTGRYNGLEYLLRSTGVIQGISVRLAMINEDIFQRNLPDFEGGGQNAPHYMIPPTIG